MDLTGLMVQPPPPFDVNALQWRAAPSTAVAAPRRHRATPDKVCRQRPEEVLSATHKALNERVQGGDKDTGLGAASERAAKAQDMTMRDVLKELRALEDDYSTSRCAVTLHVLDLLCRCICIVICERLVCRTVREQPPSQIIACNASIMNNGGHLWQV